MVNDLSVMNKFNMKFILSILLMALCFVVMPNCVAATTDPATMITEWNIPAGTTIKLPISGTGLNVDIDWGDGTTSGDVTTAFPTHTYTETDTYYISVKGNCPYWGSSYHENHVVPETSDYYTYTKYLTGLRQWGELGTYRYGFAYCSNLKYVSGDATVNTFKNLNSCYYMFMYCSGLKSIDLSNFDTSQVTSMHCMFGVCSVLTTLDVTYLDTSSTTDMGNMFSGCIALKKLDLSKFDTSKVTNMNQVFHNCKALEELDISSFDTKNVTNMHSMFQYCGKLPNLNLSHFDTSKVTKMDFMFNGCALLQTITFGANFDTSQVTTMNAMFQSCSELTKLDLSKFNTSKVNDMSWIFNGCTSLQTITFGANFDTSQVTTMKCMFQNCSALTKLDLSNFDTSKVKDMSWMFWECRSLTELDMSKWNTSNVTTMKQMFGANGKNGDMSLKKLDISSFNTSKVTSMKAMFYNCPSLTNLDLTSFDTSSISEMSLLFSGDKNLKSALITNKFIISGDTTDMFADTNPAFRFITISRTPVANQFKGILSTIQSNTTVASNILLAEALEEDVRLYVPNGTEAAYASALADDVDESQIAPILQMDVNTSIDVGTEYTEPTFTVAGFTEDESGDYTAYGFSVKSSGRVNTDSTGSYPVTYSLARTTSTDDEEIITKQNYTVKVTTTEEVASIIKEVTVLDDANLITKHPVTLTAKENESAVFTVEADGDNLEYIWVYRKPVADFEWEEVPASIGTANGNTLTITNVSKEYQGYAFSCLVKGEFNELSNAAYLYVEDADLDSDVEMALGDKKTMITEWTISGDNTTIKLPVQGDGLKVTIDWGDGTISGDVTTEFPEHKYEEAGTYYIKVRGICPVWGYNGESSVNSDSPYNTYTLYLTGLQQWGELQATKYGFSNCVKLKYVSGDATDKTFEKVTDMMCMFYNCSALTSIDLSKFDTSNVTTMRGMFYQCTLITNLDVSSFDTSKVTNMQGMFMESIALTSLDLSSFNVSNVTNMWNMFYNCKALTNLDLSSFNTSKVTTMIQTFYGCKLLTNLNLSNFNTSSVTMMTGMFKECSSLKDLNISSFNTANVTDMSSMFNKCNSLSSLDLSSFNTSSVTLMSDMFRDCKSLTSLNLSSFNTSNVTEMDDMFYNCESLTSLDLSNFNTSNVTKMVAMFRGCKSLTTLDLSNFDTSKVTTMNAMFYDCTSLKNLNISSFNTQALTDMTALVANTALETLDLTSFDTSKITSMRLVFSGDTNLKSVLISNKFVIKGTTTNMFAGINPDLRFITVSSTPVANQFSTVLPSTVNVYVPNEAEVAYENALKPNLTEARIRPFVELSGDANMSINMGDSYEEQGALVFGFTEAESEYYTPYGYGFVQKGAVDPNAAGVYKLSYELTRFYESGDSKIEENTATVIRIVEVINNKAWMITEWTISGDNTTIKLPVTGIGLKIDIDWGDGTFSGDVTTEFPEHKYDTKGTYYIRVKGNCPEWGYASETEVLSDSPYYTYTQYLTGLRQWGELQATKYGFAYCAKLKYVSGDATDKTFEKVTDMSYMFYDCNILERIDLSNFDTSNVTSMNSMFAGVEKLKKLDLSSFDTSKVTTMYGMFNSCFALTDLNVSSFDTSKVTTMHAMFQHCEVLEKLSLSNFNTSSVTNMWNMFRNCYALKTLDLSSFNTSNVETMFCMFLGCNSLESLDLSSFNTSNVNNMGGLFEKCYALKSLNLNDFDTSNVTNMNSMFAECTSLMNINISTFNTSNVTEMYGMFYKCSVLTSIDLSNFDTSKVTTMLAMFQECSSLENLDLSNFNMSKVTTTQQMFNKCYALKTLDLSNFDTTAITNTSYMLKDCQNLKSVLISNKFVIKGTTTNMFAGINPDLRFITVSTTPVANQFSTVLPSTVNVYVPNEAEVAYENTLKPNLTEARIRPMLELLGDEDVALNVGESYVEAGALAFGFTEAEREYYEPFGYSLTRTGIVTPAYEGTYEIVYDLNRNYNSGDEEIHEDTETVIRIVQVINNSAWMITEWTISGDNTTIKLPVTGTGLRIDIDWGDGKFSGDVTSEFPEHKYDTKGTYYIRIRGNCPEWGYASETEVLEDSPYYTYTQYLTGLQQWGDLQATKYGFAYCGKLKYVSGDATDKTFEKVTDMSYMFAACNALERIDLSEFDTSKVTSMRSMFNECTVLTELDLSSFDTSNVTSMNAMFIACESLIEIDVSSFDTSKVTDMTGMFNKCYKLTSLDLSNFDTSNVTDMSYMFAICNELINLDVSGFDTAKVTNMSYMFNACSELTRLNLSSFDTSKVTDMYAMFNRCNSLTSLDLSNFDTSNVTDMSIMFYLCSKLTSLDISSFNTSNVTTMYLMFYKCNSLTSLNLNNFNTLNVTDMNQMFRECSSLKSLKLNSFDTSNVTNMSSMFYLCSNLTSLDVSNFNTVNVTDVGGMFADCSSLESIDVTNFDTSKVENFNGLFFNCSSLTSLDLTSFSTNSASNMSQVFRGTTNLKSVLISNKFLIKGTTSNTFNGINPALRFITVSTTPVANQFSTVLPSTVNVYVPNEAEVAYENTLKPNLTEDRILPIIEPIGASEIDMLKGTPYIEQNYTVAGFGISEAEYYMPYGYEVEIQGAVNPNEVGEYEIKYIATNPYKDSNGYTAYQTNTATRTVNVYDGPQITLYENGEIYDGDWTNQDVVGILTLLSDESEWVAVKVENGIWSIEPSYAEIVKSGDQMIITFNKSINGTIYVREVDAAGKATTFDTAGNIVKIDKEVPVIEEISYKTKDQVLKLEAKVKDKVSMVEKYAVTQNKVEPASWNEAASNEITHDLKGTSTYYLWVKDHAGNMASGEILAVKDIEPPKGIIDISAKNIVSGDEYQNIIIVNPDKIFGEKYTNEDIVTVRIYVEDNETEKEKIMFALYNEEDYALVKAGTKEIEWQQYKEEVDYTLKTADGQNTVYVVFKDEAGNVSISLGEVEESIFKIAGLAYAYEYTGSAIEPEITVKDGEKTLVEDTDYDVIYENNIEAGTAIIRIKGLGTYANEEKTEAFMITKKEMQKLTITLDENIYTYDGTEKMPGVTVAENNLDSVAVAMSAVGTSMFAPSHEFKTTVGVDAHIDPAKLQGHPTTEPSAGDTFVYRLLANATQQIIDPSNYDVTYTDNIDAGTATVTVTGKGNYKGTVSKTFTIEPKTLEGVVPELEELSFIFDGTEKTPKVTLEDLELGTIEKGNYTVTYTNNINAGTATVTITGKGNYKGTITKTFEITMEGQITPGLYETGSNYTVRLKTWEELINEGIIVVEDGTVKEGVEHEEDLIGVVTPCELKGELVIPNDENITNVGSFYLCENLTGIVISNSITSIGESAFLRCGNLTSVTIPDSVTSIGGYAFGSCISLTSVTIPDSVTNIGRYAFVGCAGLTSVTIPDSVTSIGDYAFASCSALTSATFKDTDTWYVTTDSTYTGGTQVTVTDTETAAQYLRSTYKDYYWYKEKVEEPELAPGLYQTGSNYTVMLKTWEELINEGIIVVEDGTVKEGVEHEEDPLSFEITPCELKGELVIPNDENITNVGSFYLCENLTGIVISNSITSIGESAFWRCGNLTSVTIPDSVTSIGGYAFEACISLTSVTIPDSVTSIGECAFNTCTSLTSITIPDSVTSIGYTAFEYCYNLEAINVDTNNLAYCSVDGVLYTKDMKTLISYPEGKADTIFTIPDSVTSIGYKAFNSCSSLTNVTIPDSVTSIGDYAFASCSALTSATFKDTDTWYVTTNSTYTGGTQVTVTDTSTAAQYLRDTYEGYYWYKE